VRDRTLERDGGRGRAAAFDPRPSTSDRPTLHSASQMRDHGSFVDRSGECEHWQDAFLDVTRPGVDGSGRRGGLQERLFDSSR
jgi:hypothetical protein